MLRLALAAFLISTACAGPSLSFSELEIELELARCQRLARCGLFPDEATCTAHFAPIPDQSLAAAIGHTVAYDGERAKQCVDALAELGCDTTARDVRVPPQACIEMLRGKIADNGTCYFNTECESGLCVLEPGCAGGCCTGTCKPKLGSQIGGPCESSRDCVGDAYCGTDMVCQPLAAVGQDCSADADCQYGLACINPLPISPGTCREVGHVGEPCPYLRCADEGLRCDATNTCVPVGLPGTSCADFRDCSPYMQCDGQSLQCREFPALGQQCDVMCQGSAWCARPGGGPVGTCTEPQENGAPCGAYNECASYFCEEGPVFDSCQDQQVCF